MQNNFQKPSSAHLGILFVSDERRYQLIDKFGVEPAERLALERLLGRGRAKTSPKVSQTCLSLDILRRPRITAPQPPQPPVGKVNSRQFRHALEELQVIAAGPQMSSILNSQDTDRAIHERIWYFGLDLPAISSLSGMRKDERQALEVIYGCIASAVGLLKCTQFVLAVKRSYELICSISPRMRSHMRKLAIAHARILEERVSTCRVARKIGRTTKRKKRGLQRMARHSNLDQLV